jgi:hypothetical protein
MDTVFFPDHVIDTTIVNDPDEIMKLRTFYQEQVKELKEKYLQNRLDLLTQSKLQCAQEQLQTINMELSKINIYELSCCVEDLQTENAELRDIIESMRLQISDLLALSTKKVNQKSKAKKDD